MTCHFCQETGEITKQLDDPNLLQNRPPLQRLLVISAGIIANFLLTFLISFGVSSTSGISKIFTTNLRLKRDDQLFIYIYERCQRRVVVNCLSEGSSYLYSMNKLLQLRYHRQITISIKDVCLHSILGLSRPVFDNGILVSATPDKTSPGYVAGLRVNDMIVKYNDAPLLTTNEKTNQEFIQYIRGRADTPINLDILRDGKILLIATL